jgi:HEPN domain-containing protein
MEEARILLDNRRPNGCIFLAGSAVECLFKALIPANSTPRERPKLLERLKTEFGHDLELLRTELVRRGVPMGRAELAAFRAVSLWDNDIRYRAAVQSLRAATAFFRGAEALFRWAERRGARDG